MRSPFVRYTYAFFTPPFIPHPRRVRNDTRLPAFFAIAIFRGVTLYSACTAAAICVFVASGATSKVYTSLAVNCAAFSVICGRTKTEEVAGARVEPEAGFVSDFTASGFFRAGFVPFGFSLFLFPNSFIGYFIPLEGAFLSRFTDSPISFSCTLSPLTGFIRFSRSSSEISGSAITK